MKEDMICDRSKFEINFIKKLFNMCTIYTLLTIFMLR